MQNLTPEGLRAVTDIAQRHGVSADAAVALLDALVAGGGRQAQFNHPDLGGMGQWSQGGMIMVGDMFNHGLKSRIDALCNDLAALIQNQPSALTNASQSQSQSYSDGFSLFAPGTGSPSQWWPAELGRPGSAGAQNDMRYAFFPETRRLAIQQDSRVSVYDTGEHSLSGFSQQQGGDRSLTFTSPSGLVRLADLTEVPAKADQPKHASPMAASDDRHTQRQPAPPPHPTASTSPLPAPTASSHSMDDILKTIERLSELREKGVLTEEEFAAKKSELLSRL
jgi:hypothetical protein